MKQRKGENMVIISRVRKTCGKGELKEWRELPSRQPNRNGTRVRGT